jgi:hypothetical protein
LDKWRRGEVAVGKEGREGQEDGGRKTERKRGYVSK